MGSTPMLARDDVLVEDPDPSTAAIDEEVPV